MPPANLCWRQASNTSTATAFDRLRLRWSGRIDRALARWLATESDDGEAMSAERLAQRTLILRALLDGLKMRQAREPDMDLDLLADALRDALPKLMND